jgi:hypothetical protein
VYASPDAHEKTIKNIAALGVVVERLSASPERTMSLDPDVGILVQQTDRVTGSWPDLHCALGESMFCGIWADIDLIHGQYYPEFVRKVDYREWGAWLYRYSLSVYFSAWTGVLMHYIMLLAFQGKAELLALELLQMAGNVAVEQHGGVVPDPLPVSAMSVLVGEDLVGRLGGGYKSFLNVGASREDIRTLIESRKNLHGMERAVWMIWGLYLLLGVMWVYLHTLALYHLFIWGTNDEIEAEYMGMLRGIKIVVAILRKVGVLRTE